ncbi:MAG: tandem-95 repeat protein [Crocinitomicaceae bacterium]|nr:tandem-95 repeat protein [Crocinitomicaceae bacterium]
MGFILTASSQNSPPTSGNENLSIDEDAFAPATIGSLLSNNFDSDGDPLSVLSVTSSVPGTFIVNNVNGSIGYYTSLNYCGIDTIVYDITDGTAVVTDTLFLTINCINDAPEQGNETMTVNEDDPATTTVDLLANNTDVEGDIITMVSYTNPSNGTIVDNGNGTFDYTPNADFCGIDTVSYIITDGLLNTTDLLIITVNCINDAPTGGNESLIVDEDAGASTSVNLIANNSDVDGDNLSMGTFTTTGGGTYVDNGNNTITYTPAQDFCGTDTVAYEVTDGLEVIIDTLFIVVNCVNDNPSNGNELVYTDPNVIIPSIDLLANNVDIENDLLNVSNPTFPFTTPEGGVLTLNGDGTISYTPPIGWEGIEIVTYDVCDDGLPFACVTDTITFVVSPDTDLDGVVNLFDLDDDNDGISDEDELLTASNNGDTDGDGIPDILDLDSDNDGVHDILEAGGNDSNNDGMVDDYVDSNMNGMNDEQETNPFPLPDTDMLGIPDFQDPDDDEDGILTSDEYDEDENGIDDDCDIDGIPNHLDPESCEIMIPEVFTPNYDGVNDYFVINGIFGYLENNLKIFNRWGNLVYEADYYQNDWFGVNEKGVEIDSGELPTGTYFYILDLGNDEAPQTGYIYLTR